MPEDHFAGIIRRAASRRKWKENRQASERVLTKRQKRYANDPEYVESIKESVRRRRGARGPSSRKRSFNRDKIIVVNGVSVCLYSSGKTAHLVGVSPRTIENWEKKGTIPTNRAKDSLGRRWYPAPFVRFLAEQAADRPKGRLDSWSKRVKESWQQIQLGDSPIPIVGDHLEDPNG